MNRLYNATDVERASADFYPTPPDLTRGLIDGLAEAAIAMPGPVLSTMFVMPLTPPPQPCPARRKSSPR